MDVPRFTQSIRFRISLLYSAMVFGLGGVVLGLLYLVIRAGLRNDTMTGFVLRPGEEAEIGGLTVVLPRIELRELRTVESVVKEYILDQIAVFTLWALLALFLLSLVVGWFVAGWALRPIDRISKVAAEIQATDLSRRIALQGPDDEMTRLAGTFDSMLDRLDRAFASQRRFLADTSHDLRNPLAVMRSNLELALSDSATTVDEWRETGEITLQSANRMSGMIDDLLAAARLEVGGSVRTDLDLAEVASGTVEGMRARAAETGHEVATDLEPTTTRGDRDAITRALANLLDNALAAAPPGTEVKVETGSADGWGWLAVSDRGPGIDPAVVTGDSPRSPGLGLSIVRQVARGHGGRLDAFLRSEGGSVLVLWLPVGAASERAKVPPVSRLRTPID